MPHTRQPTINHAINIVEDELAVVAKERRAFTQFYARIRDIDGENPTTVDRPDNGKVTAITVETPSSDTMSQVRTAYYETVMAVPHYDQEYGDTLSESLAAEFGQTLAGHVVDGQSLTPALYDALLEASKTARDQRDHFANILRREQTSLKNVNSELNEIETRMLELSEQISGTSESYQLASIDESLAPLERRCTDLANQRQELIHDRSVPTFSGIERGSLVQYLYNDLGTVEPALTDIASCLASIRNQRTRCL